jgi:DNA-binding LytR/AlgR family response regulator
MSEPTAIIAEDEAPQREALQRLLRDAWPELRIVAMCEDGLRTIEALNASAPDVAFLDIRMPGVSGLEVASQAGPRTHIVFITAYAEHAVRAFEKGAVDYLLKPVSPERLQTTIERVRARLADGARADLTRILEQLHGQTDESQAPATRWVSASVGNTVKMIPIDEIVFFQSRDKYTRVVTTADEAIIRTPLKELIGMLDPDDFWQVHRSVIVKVAAIRAAVRTPDDKYELVLAGSDERLPVSPAFKKRFRGM